MEFHGKCSNPPRKISVEKFPWNSIEIDVLIGRRLLSCHHFLAQQAARLSYPLITNDS